MRRVLLASLLVAACAEQDEPTLPVPVGEEAGYLLVKSEGFADGGDLPYFYTCVDAEFFGESPPLSWSSPSSATKSFAIVVDDLDAPDKVWVHWVVWNIAADLRAIEQGIDADDERFAQGTTDDGEVGWSPPCPPKKGGAHRYVFRVFAADTMLDLPPTTTRDELYRALDHHVLAMGEVTARFDR